MAPLGIGTEPVETAWRWLTARLDGAPVPPLLLTIGLGDGALLEALDRHAPGTRMLALEPDVRLWRETSSRARVAAWLKEKRLTYLVGPAYVGADEAWRLFSSDADSYRLIVDPNGSHRSSEHLNAARVLKQIVFGVRANAEARRRFAPLYLTNVVRNIPAIVHGRDVRALKGRLRGLPAILAAAGPSLDAVLDELRGVAKRGVIIAVDTALRPLLAAGIQPHFVVGVDPGQWNARHFQALPACPRTWLVGEAALPASAAAAFGARAFWFRVGQHQPWPWLNTVGVDVGRLPVWGSVLTAAFEVASLAGCDPIVLVGADLAYTDGRPYCRGTTYEFDWALAAGRGTDVHETWRQRVRSGKPLTVTDLHGRPTTSTGALVSFRDWLVAQAQKKRERIINATGAGILFGKGLDLLPLAEAVARRHDIPSIDALSGPTSAVSRNSVSESLVGQRDAVLDTTAPFSSPLAEWASFAGEGFDRQALQHALNDAIGRLNNVSAGGGSQPERADLESRVALTMLPEALSRLRAGLGEPAAGLCAPFIGSPTRDELLAEALDLLESICARVGQLDDLVPACDLHRPEGRLVSAAYHWPDDLRWAILAFESLLGRAWSGSVPVDAPRLRAIGDRLAGESAAGTEQHVPELIARARGTLAEQWLRCAAATGVDDCFELRARFIQRYPRLGQSDRARILTGRLVSDTAESPESGSAQAGRALVRPRVLTDEGAPFAITAYETRAGAVCVVPHTTESLLVAEDGSIGTASVWERPISGELPWGEGGAIAWNDGLRGTAEGELPYVMARPDKSAHAALHYLPFRPVGGAWIDGRIFWIGLPVTTGGWCGIASWAPRSDVRLEVPDILPIDLHPAGDGIVLEPCDRDGGYRPIRRVARDGWRWRPGAPLIPTEVGRYGASSSRSNRHGWTAIAHPEADVVRLVSTASGREVVVACDYPFKLAWVGRSLLVSTLSREVILFEGLVHALRTCP